LAYLRNDQEQPAPVGGFVAGSFGGGKELVHFMAGEVFSVVYHD
jgi:hypothetical protein